MLGGLCKTEESFSAQQPALVSQKQQLKAMAGCTQATSVPKGTWFGRHSTKSGLRTSLGASQTPSVWNLLSFKTRWMSQRETDSPKVEDNLAICPDSILLSKITDSRCTEEGAEP